MKRILNVCFVLYATIPTALLAQTFHTLLSFDNSDGANPEAGLLLGADGNLYGTTFNGGANRAGTVFKITPKGLTTLYSFCSQGGCADGQAPAASLVQAADGSFYGTTSAGGANCAGSPLYGCGTVFKITPGGSLTTLYNFCAQSQCSDGSASESRAALVQAANGDFYGTTASGGTNGSGTVFKITPDGALTTIYNFCSQSGCSDGAVPLSGLVQASNGDLYGTTVGGGDGVYGADYGTVFKITPGGMLTTLYSFCSQSGCTDGKEPAASLVQAANGDFYGSTQYGGANCTRNGAGCGTIFKIAPGGKLATLHRFCAGGACRDGLGPSAALIQAADGNLYGTTSGDRGNAGTIFQITPAGKLTTLYTFCSQIGCADKYHPFALSQAPTGEFYGTTYSGGTRDAGTVFSLSAGLGPL